MWVAMQRKVCALCVLCVLSACVLARSLQQMYMWVAMQRKVCACTYLEVVYNQTALYNTPTERVHTEECR